MLAQPVLREKTMVPEKYHVPFPLLAERYFGAGEVAKVV